MSTESSIESVALDGVPERAPSEVVSRPAFVARVIAILIPALICVGGIAFAAVLVLTRPEAERTDRESNGLPVRVQPLAPSTEPIAVVAQGQVIAARLVVMQPELSGRVIWMNDDLVPGGRLAAGATLVRIDARDYRSALEVQRAQLENNRLQISQEESRRVIAEREWALLGSDSRVASDQGRELALREPHLRSARASLRAAESGVQRARDNVSRTSVSAPFDAIVQSENVDLGQVVGPQSQIATLVGTEHFWVRVAVPMDQLRWVRVPNGDTPGSSVTISQQIGENETIERTGRVIRLLGDLDPMGRMARVLVEIDDPLGLERDDGGLPILLGAFVNVTIDAGSLDDVYRIPRDALHAGDTVYLFFGGTLQMREVDIVWREVDTVLVRGLEPRDELVMSRLATPIEGTTLRRAEEEDAGTP